MNSILPQFYPSAWKKEFGLAGSVFAPGVSLGFVERGNGAYSFLTSEDHARHENNFDDLLLIALSNLAALKDGVELHIAKPLGTTVAWLTAHDNFAAVCMLIPGVKSKLQFLLGEQFLFSIPSRDLCLFWDIKAPSALTQKHAQEAADDFEFDEYKLSPRVFVFSDIWPCAVYVASA